MLSHLQYTQNLGGSPTPPGPPSPRDRRTGRGRPRRPAWEAACVLPIAKGWVPCELLAAGARPSPWVPSGLLAQPHAEAQGARTVVVTTEEEGARALTIDDLLEGYVAPVCEGAPRIVQESAWTGPPPEELRALVSEVASLRGALERVERERREERILIALGFALLIALAVDHSQPRRHRG